MVRLPFVVLLISLSGCFGIKTSDKGVEIKDGDTVVERLIGVRSYATKPFHRYSSGYLKTEIFCFNGYVWKMGTGTNPNWEETKYKCKTFDVESF